MSYTDLDRIVEQIEEIPWSDSYVWREKKDFIAFVCKLKFWEGELESQLDELNKIYDKLDSENDSLQEDYDLLEVDFDKLESEYRELEEKYEKLNE